MIRSYPFYGKTDFFLLDGRPWWPKWELLITETVESANTTVYTDYITGYILAGVFGKNTVVNVGRHKIPTLNIEDMEENKLIKKQFLSLYMIRGGGERKTDFQCVINLIGYESSWVPDETRHWSSKLADTSRFYRFRSSKIPSLFVGLELSPPKKCKVYSPAPREE